MFTSHTKHAAVFCDFYTLLFLSFHTSQHLPDMANNRNSSTCISRPSLFGCVSTPNITPEEPITTESDMEVPMIALVNGLSGGHKGEKVLRILHQRQIPSYDLLQLSTNEDYFNTFIHQLVQVYQS